MQDSWSEHLSEPSTLALLSGKSSRCMLRWRQGVGHGGVLDTPLFRQSLIQNTFLVVVRHVEHKLHTCGTRGLTLYTPKGCISFVILLAPEANWR